MSCWSKCISTVITRTPSRNVAFKFEVTKIDEALLLLNAQSPLLSFLLR